MKRFATLILSLVLSAPSLGADFTMIVDTGVTVPVNIVPLADSTDFTREDSIAYNATGIEITWNFVTTGGVMSQTEITPTTSGDYDWTAADTPANGMYKIEIPASGGASVNNDTEGFGWITGHVDGVADWRGPTIAFVPSNIALSTINGSDLLDVSTVQIEGSDATDYVETRTLAAANYFDFSTDSVRIVDGTGTGEIDTSGGAIVRVLEKPGITYTIETVDSQTAFLLAAPGGLSAIDDYTDWQAVVRDVSTGAPRLYASVRRVTATAENTPGQPTITVSSAPNFTVQAGDIVELYPPDLEMLTRIPNATAGAAGGVFIAGTNAQTTVTSGFGANSITATSVADDAITAAKIASDAIGASEIAADAIGASEIATDAIGAAEIAADAIGASEMAANAIGSAEIANDAIGATEVADGAIDAGAIATDAITAAKIAPNAITNSEVDATAVDEFWDEPQSGHSTAGTFGFYVDSAVSAVSVGGLTLEDIAVAVLAEFTENAGTLDDLYTGSQLETDVNAIEGGAGSGGAGLLQATTIASLASQTSFTLTAGSSDNDVYNKENGVIFIITDQATAEQKAVVSANDYIGSTKTVALSAAPGFTIQTGDSVEVVATGFAPGPVAKANAEVFFNNGGSVTTKTINNVTTPKNVTIEVGGN